MHVTVDEVGHRFASGSWLFRNLSFQFAPGNVYALTGPSGSGKSTLLSLIARLSKPVEGRIDYEQITKVSWVFQNPFGAPRRTALDHVTLPLLGGGATLHDAEEHATSLLERFGLGEVRHRQFRELSGGEAQRLMLARGLASNPSLLLVDEPTAQLDRNTAAQVDKVIGSTATSDTIVIVATHDQHTRDSCTAHLDLGEFALTSPQ